MLERRHHLSLFLPIHETVLILHRDKRRKLVGNCIVLHCLELVGVAARHPDVSCIAGFDYIMQSLHGLGDRSVVVEAMALDYVDIIEL